jgi:FtsP/CotA-like multicopper oxidase with cupredoxin domain
MHLVQFLILDRQPFDIINGEVTPTGPRVPPPANEAGWKDTARVDPNEILRVIDSMQLTARHRLATPVNWQPGEDVIIVTSVSNDEAKTLYPNGWKQLKPYLRIVPHPEKAR